MTKTDRKIVHEFANKLNLKSKSTGDGRGRFTTIIKTSRSAAFEQDEEAINSILRQGKFMKRMDVGGRSRVGKSLGGASSRGGGGGGGGRGGGGGGGRTHEGMVVGAEAPALSATNRGRIMLEKMGFKSGMTLGAEGNTGIHEPVMAIIKMSKAGLG